MEWTPKARAPCLCAAAAIAFALVTGQPAAAGAWPRERGVWFFSSAVTFGRPAGARTVAAETSFFAEGGLGGGWFVQGEATLPQAGGGDVVLGIGHAGRRAGGSLLGLSMGLGRRWQAGGGRVVYLRPELAWGRSLAPGAGIGPLRLPYPGWVVVDLQAELWLAPRRVVPKLDVTFGVKPSHRWTLMMELWADNYPGAGLSVRIGPAAILRMGRFQLALQPEIPLRGGEGPRLKLALWSEF